MRSPRPGPTLAGAGITTLPNYQLWVKDVNEAGGIKVGDKKLKIEVVEYDDRSSSEEAVRAVERLATQDKVDFLLPPWGTANNLAVGPIFDRYGYPQLAGTAVTDKAPDLSQSAGRIHTGCSGPVENMPRPWLACWRNCARTARSATRSRWHRSRTASASSCPMPDGQPSRSTISSSSSMRPIRSGPRIWRRSSTRPRRSTPDVFVAFSYPPDTIGLTAQAQVLGFNPKIFYAGVGVAFPIYKKRFGEATAGVISLGGVNASSDRVKDYIARHAKAIGQEPDRWASLATYASLQALQQAIEKAGTIDRKAVAKELASGSFDTILGTFSFDKESRKIPGLFAVGQWQSGEFVGLFPTDKEGAAKPTFPKPDWPKAN